MKLTSDYFLSKGFKEKNCGVFVSEDRRVIVSLEDPEYSSGIWEIHIDDDHFMSLIWARISTTEQFEALISVSKV